MLIKTNAIVISKIKYRDNDLIVKCYTKNRGIVSYLLRGILKNTKQNSKVACFQLLSQLHIEENYKPGQSLQFITEVKPAVIYKSLHTNVLKSAVVMFLSEVLNAVLKEEEHNESLYHFLETTLEWLDHETQFSNFHLLFLLKLTKHLGFFPDTSHIDFPYFNLSTGAFELKPQTYSITGENAAILKQLSYIKFDALSTVKLNASQRQSFLNMMLLYYELHLGDFRKPKSLQVFNQVFH